MKGHRWGVLHSPDWMGVLICVPARCDLRLVVGVLDSLLDRGGYAHTVGVGSVCLCSIVMTESSVPPIVAFASATPEVSVSRPPADRLLGGSPKHTARNYFSDATGQFFAGVWESTPGTWRVKYTENEFCHLTRGSVRIDDGHGNHWAFKAGDSFVIPAGFSGAWQVLEPTTKLYVIFEPAPG